MHSYLEYLSVILISSIKIGLGGIPLSIALGLDKPTMIILNMIGGTIGTFTFVFLSNWLHHKIDAYYAKKRNRKKFTRTNRFIIKVKKHGGVAGICFITPLLFSFPLGCFLAVHYFHDKKKIITYMLIAVVFWSVLLGTLGGINL